jgi:hypothetical protein
VCTLSGTAAAHALGCWTKHAPPWQELALQRNAERQATARLPDSVLRRADTVFEAPDQHAASFERNTLTVPSASLPRSDDPRVRQRSGVLWPPCKALVAHPSTPTFRRGDQQAWTALWEALAQAWGPPVPPLPPPAPAGPTEASHSAAHRLDLHCRRALGATAAALPDAGAKRAAGGLLNDCRRALLARCAACQDHAGSHGLSVLF